MTSRRGIAVLRVAPKRNIFGPEPTARALSLSHTHSRTPRIHPRAHISTDTSGDEKQAEEPVSGGEACSGRLIFLGGDGRCVDSCL